ncbi:MAG: Gfo/Idh/MocA family oxidoreductase [Gammaproteobacteria bacterium]|nr:Gfo/Idh/MocA family oxidoreductase [Gammaproteobacteria bacterium]MDE0285792.1 Gfo/Idh/MocA family oxidoreductase [Gammaproteobacteria bacterium]
MTDLTSGRRLRLGMVGGGQGAFIGGVHRIAARLDDRYELIAGALSTDPDRNRISAGELLIDPGRCYASYQEMAETEAERDDGIDVVAIVTPNNVHYDAARAFLEAGIHVICDKPLTTSLEDARSLARLVKESGLIFVLTHNYTGYPLVRQAREMVRQGILGRIRVLQMEYPQGWLATKIEDEGQKQAEWRTDPERSGPAGCVGDIATHAIHLAWFITGLEIEELAADLHTFVEGRQLDDNAHVLLRFTGGAKGMLWSSQVAPGNENALRIRIYGEKGGLAWDQENPNILTWSPLNDVPQKLTRAGNKLGQAAELATRIPAGHPEGYLEGFAQLYKDTAERIIAMMQNREPDPASLLVPTVDDGVQGVRFIEKCVESHYLGGSWVVF